MEYANSSTTNFTLNYTGIVNYYYYDNENNKQYLSFECKNACFRVDSLGKIYWQSGQFVDGQWYDGEWNNLVTTDNGLSWQESEQLVSVWKNGTWRKGRFYNGIWEQGVFNQGDFYFGYWYDGIFGYNTLIDQNSTANWYNGYFYGGVFSGTQWHNGAYYTNLDSKTYWLTREKNNPLLWGGGTINEQYSNVSPIQIIYNNSNIVLGTGRVTYLKITNTSYRQFEFVCSNADFSIDLLGNITISGGNYYNGQLYQVNISNSNLQGFELQSCVINDCNITNYSILLNCEVNNNYGNEISNCQWYNGIFNAGSFINSIWYDGIFNAGSFINSIWYDGLWNPNSTKYTYWKTDSQWYLGQWNGGYVDGYWQDQPPYIFANGKTYDMFTGQLLYSYQNEDYVIQVTNAGLTIDLTGSILFVSGVWENGVFKNGNFFNAQFMNGEFEGQRFENSIWHNGTFKNGIFYNSIWENGYFQAGVFERSQWENGYFLGGEFKSGYWYDGNFNGGNWLTLNSFWLGGNWISGTQNGTTPDNYSDQIYVFYINLSQLENNIYELQLLNNRYNITLYNQYGDKLAIELINSYQDCQNIGYYVNQSKLYLCFKNTSDNYFKLEYQTVINDVAPTIRLIDDYQQHMEKDDKHLITGQFTYIVTKQNEEQQYYTIKVEDANFSIQNGFIKWNHGTFKDGIWYNGEWNTNFTELYLFLQPIETEYLNNIDKCIWQNGIWMNGNWNYSQSTWLDGQWIAGTINGIESNESPNFQLGNSNNYTCYSGNIKYIYTDSKDIQHFGSICFRNADFQIENDGYIIVNKGDLIDGYWYQGEWYGDNWLNGVWENGTWYCGTWHNGIWKNGNWKQYSDSQTGNYRNVGVAYVDSELEIPSIGFFITTIEQEYDSSNSNNSHSSFNEWSDAEYESFYGNKLEDLLQDYGSSISSNSESSYSYEDIEDNYQYSQKDKIAVLIKKWVDSVWVEGFIQDVKSFYAPKYGIANGNEYKNHTNQLLYHYAIYNQNGDFVYKQYFLINFVEATFSVDLNGNIYWHAGSLLNSQWKNGQWYNGIFINSIWHNGVWHSGNFTSGVFKKGVWHTGYITTQNLTWQDGQWRHGYIDRMESYMSPGVITANNSLFVNYTGILKYYNIAENCFYKIDVKNACFFVSLNGMIVFYNGEWNDGQFVGYWRTSRFNNEYNYLLEQKIINMDQIYTYQKGSKTHSYKISMDNQMFEGQQTLDSFCIYSQGNFEQAKTVRIFLNSADYISVWCNGTFVAGTWYNGQWLDGEWLTDENNQSIGTWITGLINGMVETQPPAYQFVLDDNDFYHFVNFTGRIKYKVNFFNDQTFKIESYLTTFNCKNAYFDIKYQNITKQNQTYRKVLLIWHNGQWLNGTWHYGIWHNGQWLNGTWQTGIWLNGVWENGDWISGNWHNGIWKNGKRKHMTKLNMVQY